VNASAVPGAGQGQLLPGPARAMLRPRSAGRLSLAQRCRISHAHCQV